MTKKKTNSNKPEEIRLKVTNWDEAVPTMICRDHGASASRVVISCPECGAEVRVGKQLQ